MIKYCYQDEEWYDESDISFKVDMTPEDSTECEMVFIDQKDFWKWYNGDCLVKGN